MCRTSELAVVAENPNPGRIEHLWPIDNGGTGRDSYVPAKALKDALKRPAFANLRGLRVTHGGSLGSVLTAIAKPLGGHLEDLWLFDTQGSASVGPKQLDALSTNFGALRTLSLGANKATGEHLTELCGAVGGFLAEHPLESLVLHFQRTTSSHLEQLLPSSCPWLRRLELPLLRANDAVFDLLEGMHSLRTLRLFAFTGGPDDVHALLRRPVARRLHRLQVSWPDHVRFAETELSSLRALSFSGQTLDAFREEAPFRETLEELQLTNLAPDAQQLEELAQMFPKLRRVFANGSGDGGSQWSRLGRPIQSTGSLWLRT